MTGIKSVKITCDGTAHNLGEILGATATAKWYQFLSQNTSVEIGGDDVASQGFPLINGASMLPPGNDAEMFQFYEAAKCWYIGDNGAILNVLYPVG